MPTRLVERGRVGHESADRAGCVGLSHAGGLSRLQRDPVRAGCGAWRRAADRSVAGRADVLQRVHGEDGRLREELFSGVHARRRLRQGHRAFRILQIDRFGGDRRARPRAGRAVDRRGLRDPDLRRRVVVRRGVRGLSVRRRDVPPERDSQAAHSLHGRARRIQLHHGCPAGHAANPEHHSDDVLQDDDLGRAMARPDRQPVRSRRRPRLYREPSPRRAGARRGLRHRAPERAGAVRGGETAESLDRAFAAGGGGRRELRADAGDPARIRAAARHHARRPSRSSPRSAAWRPSGRSKARCCSAS